jgi:hypothetical protein
MARVTIASGLVQLMGKVQGYDPQSYLSSTDGTKAQKVNGLPSGIPSDELGLRNEFRPEYGWKAPYQCLRDEYWKWEYALRTRMEAASVNTWDWVKGSAHRLIDDSIVRSPTVVPRVVVKTGEPERELPISAPIWTAVEHWGKLYSFQQDSKPGRRFLQITSALPQTDKCWAQDAQKPGIFFPSRLFWEDKDRLLRYLGGTDMVHQLFALAYPSIALELGMDRAAKILQKYYKYSGLSVEAKLNKKAAAAGSGVASYYTFEIKEQWFAAEQAKVFKEKAKLWHEMQYRGVRADILREMETTEQAAARSQWWAYWRRLRDKYQWDAYLAEARGGGKTEGFEVRFRVWDKVGSLFKTLNQFAAIACFLDAMRVDNPWNYAKAATDMVGPILASYGRDLGAKGLGLISGFITYHLEFKKMLQTGKGGEVGAAIGHGLTAAGGAMAALACALEIQTMVAGSAVAAAAGEAATALAACPVAAPLILAAGLLGIIGTVIAVTAKKNPYELFTRRCLWGIDYKNASLDNAQTKWSFGPFRSWWPSGTDELSGLKQQVRALTFLMSSFVVKSNYAAVKANEAEQLTVQICPGALDRAAAFYVTIDGEANFDNQGQEATPAAKYQNFSVSYTIKPRQNISKVTAVSPSFGGGKQIYTPGKPWVDKNGTILIVLPFKNPFDAVAHVGLNVFGKSDATFQCTHKIVVLFPNVRINDTFSVVSE